MNGTGSGTVLAASPIGSGGSRLISKGPYMAITEVAGNPGIRRSRSYAFLDVLAKNVSRICSTLRLPHFGHFLFPSAYSLKERIAWNRWSHFLHLYE